MDHSERASCANEKDKGERWVERIDSVSEEVAWTDAKKAEGATSSARRTPRPPNFTGREALQVKILVVSGLGTT